MITGLLIVAFLTLAAGCVAADRRFGRRAELPDPERQQALAQAWDELRAVDPLVDDLEPGEPTVLTADEHRQKIWGSLPPSRSHDENGAPASCPGDQDYSTAECWCGWKLKKSGGIAVDTFMIHEHNEKGNGLVIPKPAMTKSVSARQTMKALTVGGTGQPVAALGECPQCASQLTLDSWVEELGRSEPVAALCRCPRCGTTVEETYETVLDRAVTTPWAGLPLRAELR